MARYLLVCLLAQADGIVTALNAKTALGAGAIDFNRSSFLDEDGEPIAVAEIDLPPVRASKLQTRAASIPGLTLRRLDPGEECTDGLRRAPCHL